MAQTPAQMAAVGKEFSHQSALFAWAAMAGSFGIAAANDPLSYSKAGHALSLLPPGNYIIAGTVLKPWQAVPELKWLHAIKNQGHGDRVRGSRSQAEGVRPGVFDTFLPVPAVRPNRAPGEPYHCLGLYIELKTPDRITHKNGGASDVQLDFQAEMRANGYAAEVCHGWEAARDCILTYLGKV